MKVLKCCENETKEAEKLTWDEMVLEEGVFMLAGDSISAPRQRFIVLKGGGTVVVLFFCMGKLEPAISEIWKSEKFIRTNETVCFGLKAG